MDQQDQQERDPVQRDEGATLASCSPLDLSDVWIVLVGLVCWPLLLGLAGWGFWSAFRIWPREMSLPNAAAVIGSVPTVLFLVFLWRFPENHDRGLSKGMRAWFTAYFQRNVVGYFIYFWKEGGVVKNQIVPRGTFVPERETTQVLMPLGGWWHKPRIVFAKHITAEKRASFSKQWHVKPDRRGFQWEFRFFLCDKEGARIGSLDPRDGLIDWMLKGSREPPWSVSVLVEWLYRGLWNTRMDLESANLLAKIDREQLRERGEEKAALSVQLDLAMTTITAAITAIDLSKRFMKSKQALVIKLNLLRGLVQLRRECGRTEVDRWSQLLDEAERQVGETATAAEAEDKARSQS